MSSIRVTFSGLISFIVGITSVITGIIFTLIVTRELTPEEFGTWNLIGGLIYYVIIVEPVISYWITREISRGVEHGKTAIVSSGLLSIGGIMVYIVISYFVSQELQSDPTVLYFAAILIPLIFLNRTLTAINLGWKPQASSYGLLAFESSKIPAGFLFVYFLQMGLEGAIMASCVAYLISIIILGIFAREKIRFRLIAKPIKKWIKLSWLSLYPSLGGAIYHLDVLIFSVLTGSVVGLAFYGAAYAVANVVGHAGFVSQSIYPKLLEGGKKEYLQENLSLFFYFAFPLSAISIVFAKPALFALNPEYEIAVVLVIFLTIRAFAYTLGGIQGGAILGVERVDLDEKASYKDFIKSRLFSIPTIYLIQFSSYAGILAIALIILIPSSLPMVDLIIYWTIISLVTQIPSTIYFSLLARKKMKISLDIMRLVKYFLISIGTFGLTYYLMQEFLIYTESIFQFLPNLLPFIVFGVGTYILITYLTDLKTRELFSGIINEMKK